MRLPCLLVTLFGATLLVSGCAHDSDGPGKGRSSQVEHAQLGPVDGGELPPADLDRVGEGDVAPDFRLESLRRGPLALSGFRGEKDVVLVFYRGHW
ncbi:MAG: hypothetical protein WD995_07095 [Gemmatimonadota bacterium]